MTDNYTVNGSPLLVHL